MKQRGMEEGQATPWKRRECPGKSLCVKGNYECDVQVSRRETSCVVSDVGIIWENKARSLPHPIYQIKFKNLHFFMVRGNRVPAS